MATSAAMTRTTVPRLRNSTVRAGLLRCVWNADIARPTRLRQRRKQRLATAANARVGPRRGTSPPSQRHQRQPPRQRLLAERASR